MAIIVKPYNFIPGTVIRSAQVNADFDTLYSDYNGNITNANIAAAAAIAYSKLQALPSAQIIVGNAGNVATPVAMSGDATISNTGVVTIGGSGGAVTPVGSIIPFYDFNGLATFNPLNWTYCDGSVIGGAGPLAGQTLPDLSGRYLVGFGTDGGGDIDTAPWATPPVGNAGHQINIQHSHTVNAHTHDMGNHTHNVGNHTHSISNYTHAHAGRTNGMSSTALENSANYRIRDDGAGWTQRSGGGADRHIAVDSGSNDEGQHDHDLLDDNHNHGGATGASGGVSGTPSTNNTSSESPGTNNQLSSTQSIQPRSIRIRFIMRIL